MDGRALLIAIALLASACGSDVAVTGAQDDALSTSAPPASSEPDDPLAFEDADEWGTTTSSTTATIAAGTGEQLTFDDLATRVAVHLNDTNNDFPFSFDGPEDERPVCAQLIDGEPELLIRSLFSGNAECLPRTWWGPDGFAPPTDIGSTETWYKIALELDRQLEVADFDADYFELREFDDSPYGIDEGSIQFGCLIATPSGDEISGPTQCTVIWRYEVERGDAVLFLTVQGPDLTGETQAGALDDHLVEILETFDRMASS